MRISVSIIAASLLLAGCGSRETAPGNRSEAAAPGSESAPATGSEPAPPAPPGGEARASGWELQSSGEGVALALALAGSSGGTAIRLFCPSGQRRLLVNVPGFHPIGSEERLSFGGGGDAVALVADTRGDARRGGVSGAGAVPRNLAALIAGELSASYGSQTSGPHPAPPPNLAQRFAAACYERLSVPPAAPPGEPPSATVPVSACMMQSGEPLRVAPLRAVGTEPFWAARIEGRCVSYSDPDDQLGTRVWTRYTPASGGGGSWSGALGGRPFELRVRPQPGCSDGMSDRRYPFAAALTVDGEERTGCAEPR